MTRLFGVLVPLSFIFLTIISSRLNAQPGGTIADSVKTFLTDENMNSFLGFGSVIVQKGQPDFVYSYGYNTNEGEVKWSDSTIFNLGSVSKLFTAIAVVKLANEGLLRLDDPVYYHFPEFLDIQGKSRQAPNVTILDLLQHRSGITQSMEHFFPEKFGKGALHSEEEFYENTYNYRAFMSMEDFRNRFIMYGRLDKTPHKKYHYSNMNYILLGYIVEDVIGLNIAQIVTNKIFVPLEMNDSHYYETPDSLVGQLARGYYKLKDGSYLNIHENEVESPSPTGDGGIKTSMRDMMKFMHFVVGDYKKDVYDEVLPRSLLLSMMSPHQKGPDRDTWVGLGFHNLQPYNFSGHAGGWDGFQGMIYFHPESHSAIFLITNREDNEIFGFLRVFAAYAMLFRDFK